MANFITIKTNIETKNATAQLTSLENRVVKTADKIEALKKEMEEMSSTKVPTKDFQDIKNQIKKDTDALNKLQARMEKFLETGGKTKSSSFTKMKYDAEELSQSIEYAKAEQQELINAGQAYQTAAEANPEKYEQLANNLKNAEREMEALNQKYDEMKKKAAKSFSGAGNIVNNFGKRIRKLLANVFIFTTITKAFRAMVTGMQEGFKNLAQYSSQYNNNMSRLSSVNAELKNNMAAAFEPIMNWIVPALATLVGWLSTAMETVSKFFAVLSGKNTYTKASKQAINYANSVKQADSAQKGALASFDDLNVLDQNSGSSSGGGGGEVSGAGAFEQGTVDDGFLEKLQTVKGIMEQILPFAILIGGALAAWKIFDFVSKLMEINPILGKIIGWIAVIGGAILAVYNYFKMWTEGVDWEGIIGYVAGVAIAFGGLMALGQPFTAGLVLIVAGIAGVILAIKDMCENGATAENLGLMFISVIGIIIGVFVAFGAQAALVVGAIILLIAGVAAIIIALKEWIETGELSTEKFWMLEAGIMAVGVALGILLGWPALIVAAIVALVVAIVAHWDEIKAKTVEIWTAIKNKVASIWTGIKTSISTVMTAIKTGISNALNNIKTTWITIWTTLKTAVTNIFNGIWDAIKGVINSILGGIESMANGVVNGINTVINALNSLKFTVPDWVPVLGGKSWSMNIATLSQVSLPRLANGGITTGSTLANIGEAGREAVLPLENNTGWMQDLADQLTDAMGVKQNVTLTIDGKDFARLVLPYMNNESSRRGISLAAN